MKHLYRVELVLVEAGTATLAAPLALRRDEGGTYASFAVDESRLAQADLAIRTGEHAPLAETVYVVHVQDFVAPER